MLRKLLFASLLLLLLGCGKNAEPPLSEDGAGSDAPTLTAAAAADEAVQPIFGLPRLAGTTVEFQSEALAHARIDSSVRETVSKLLAVEAKFAVTRFDSGTRLVAMDGTGRSIFVYRLPGESDTMLSYFAAARQQEAGDGSAAPSAPAMARVQKVRRGAAAGVRADEEQSGSGGIKVGSDGMRFSRPDSLAAMQRLLERPTRPLSTGERRAVPNQPILDAAGRPTGYERTLYGRVVRSSAPPRVTPIRRNEAVSQY